MATSGVSALVVVHNEEKQLADCLRSVAFADQIVVVLDKCTDGSKLIAQQFNAKIVEGSWEIEGVRRNTGIATCDHEWVFELDADERASPELGQEIHAVLKNPTADYYQIPVDNFIGKRLVRYGWGGSFGKSEYGGLFRRTAKHWGNDRVHPALTWRGQKGQRLHHAITHYVDRDLRDTLQRLNRYSDLRAQDLRAQWQIGGKRDSLLYNYRRFVSRFIKCYVVRGGWREGGYGLVLAWCAAMYPLLSYLKAQEND